MLTGLFISANAQITIIPKIGISVSKVAYEVPVVNIDKDDLESVTGLVLGAGLEYKVNDLFSFQPELLYIQKGGRIDLGIVEGETKLNYLEIPLLAKFNFAVDPVKLYLNAGPSLGFGIGGENKGNILGFGGSGDIDFGDGDDELKPVDVGLQVGGGVGYPLGQGTLLLDLRYGAGLSNLSNAEDFMFKNRTFTVAVGYAFSL